jgi:molybdopterin/thiamine biosynthesis adenylyltransferase
LGKTVAVFGLSVGSNAVDAMLRSGIGGKYVIGDMDVLEPPNLNRINATYEQLGLSKVDILAQRISEVDPYIDQVHFRHGYSTDVKKRLTTESPDIIIEEVDNMTVMALLRIFAREHGVPLVSGTDIDLRSIIDIERYDRNGTRMFNGRLTDKDIRKLLQHDTAGDVNTEREKEPGAEDRVDDTTALMIKHLGLTNISLRMIRSSIGRHDLGDSFPQLGTTATMTGALVAVAAREILLGKDLKSGRYVENPRKTLALQCEHNVRQVTTTLASLMRYMRR